MIVAAVPVKDLEQAKQRLIPVLSPDQRRALARAMLRDVLRALTRAVLDQIWVVTRHPEVEAIATAFGCRVLGENANRGHTAAARLAQAAAAAAGARVFVTVPGDVPCVVPEEVNALVQRAGAAPTAAFAPSRSGAGTNGVALAPPDAILLRFGEPSFADHLAAARQAGLEPHVLSLPGLALDVDDAEDLRALLDQGSATESGQLTARWVLGAQLPAAVRAGR